MSFKKPGRNGFHQQGVQKVDAIWAHVMNQLMH